MTFNDVLSALNNFTDELFNTLLTLISWFVRPALYVTEFASILGGSGLTLDKIVKSSVCLLSYVTLIRRVDMPTTSLLGPYVPTNWKFICCAFVDQELFTGLTYCFASYISETPGYKTPLAVSKTCFGTVLTTLYVAVFVIGVVSPSIKICAVTVISSPIRVLSLFGACPLTHVIVASAMSLPLDNLK